MMTGHRVGAVLTAVLALVLVQPLGWRARFVVGWVVGLETLTVLWLQLPESAAFLAARSAEAGRDETAVPPARSGDVLKGRYLQVGLGLWVASFMGLLLVARSISDALQQGHRAGLVRAGGGLPGPAVDQAGEHPAGVRRGAALGIFVFSAQVLVYGFVGHLYPP